MSPGSSRAAAHSSNGYSVAALGIAFPLLKRDFTIAPLIVGLIGAALVLGAVAGSSLGGIAADRFGRKPVFLADMAILALGSLISALAPDPRFIVLGQFVIGIGIGIDFPTSGSYVSELMPTHARSRMVVATIALQSVGMVVAALVSLAILALHPAMTDWRLLLGASGALALLFLAGRTQLQESPRWLASKGRMQEALSVLKWMGDTARRPASSPTRRRPRGPPSPSPPPASGISSVPRFGRARFWPAFHGC